MLKKEEVAKLMTGLAARRRVFHSEADLQHELAWEIHRAKPELGVRLECPIGGVGAVDIVLSRGSERFLLELKYKTRALKAVVDGEAFNLRGHAAQNENRYRGLKDICRIERSGAPGAAIFLTNDPLYWEAGDGGAWGAFSMIQGRKISGTSVLSLPEDNARTGFEPLGLRGDYHLDWQDYGNCEASRFKFLLNMVTRS